MKWINLVLALAFLLFALVQYNDPDPWGWMAVYLMVAAVSAFSAFGKSNRYVVYAGLGVVIIWAGFILPEFINWINMGMPNIVESMKAETPYVEFTREFLGLVLCAAALVWQLVTQKRRVI